MEPMNLGSPVGSPTIATSAPSNAFLPAYLMGDSQVSGRVPPAGGLSPGRTSTVRQFSTSTAMPSPGSPQHARELFFSNRLGSERTSGPPTLSLMGVSQSPAKPAATSVDQQRTLGLYTGTPFPTPTKDVYSPLCTNTPVDASSLGLAEHNWVTVFGFPCASASYILTQFAQLGTVIEQRLPGTGNWMHLKYQTKIQARKALSKNGKIYNGSIMVGVMVCDDTIVICPRTPHTPSLEASVLLSPNESQNISGTSLNHFNSTPKAHIRPLTQAYHASRAEIEVASNPSTPKKSDGIVSRAIQHILGI